MTGDRPNSNGMPKMGTGTTGDDRTVGGALGPPVRGRISKYSPRRTTPMTAAAVARSSMVRFWCSAVCAAVWSAEPFRVGFRTVSFSARRERETTRPNEQRDERTTSEAEARQPGGGRNDDDDAKKARFLCLAERKSRSRAQTSWAKDNNGCRPRDQLKSS